jgi:hypothetical protein
MGLLVGILYDWCMSYWEVGVAWELGLKFFTLASLHCLDFLVKSDV